MGSLVEAVGGMGHVLALTLIASGTLACFFGYHLFRFVLVATGLLAGGSLGWMLFSEAGYGQPVAIAAGLLGAVLGAVGLFFLFSVGVFLFGCGLGLLIAAVSMSIVGAFFNVVIAIAAAVLGGVVTLLAKRLLIVVSTAATGAWNILWGVSLFVPQLDLTGMLSDPDRVASGDAIYTLCLAGWFLLAISGILVQLKTRPRRRKRRL